MMEYKYCPTGTIDPAEFQRLYAISFHRENDHLSPSNVVLIYDEGEYVGFLDINHVSKESCFLKYIGFAEFSPKTLHYCKQAFDYINGLGYKMILGGIFNTNRLALLWAIRAGFTVMGFKVLGTQGYVEIIRNGTPSPGSYKRGI